MSGTTLERRVQGLEDIHAITQLIGRRAYPHSVGTHRPDREVTFEQPCAVNVAPALRPDPPEPYDGFDETTSCTDKLARAERVINNESEDQ